MENKAVQFNYADVRPITLRRKGEVKKFVQSIFRFEGVSLHSLQYVFCSDSYLLKINQDFLRHDFYTDIITFDLSAGQGVTGEIYISVDRVRENALSESVSLRDELLRVIFHGALHLCGYRDKTKREITLMREKEDYYLSSFGTIKPLRST